MQTYSLDSLLTSLESLSAKLASESCNSNVDITGVSDLKHAKPGDIAFIRDQKNAEDWKASQASAAIISDKVDLAAFEQAGEQRPLVQVTDADLGIAMILEKFWQAPERPQGIASTAIIHEDAKVAATAHVGEGCYVGPDVVIGENTFIHANVTINGRSKIGKDCEVFSGCVIREDAVLGDRVILQPNVTVGNDGFNYRPSETGLTKIPHIGGVLLHDDVEIGANTCIDRGKFNDTVIGQGTKIDNLCQIAHNCVIGKFCIIAGHCGISGSCVLGDGVMLGGGVGLKDHLTIGDGVKIAASSGVMHDIPAGETWGGTPAKDIKVAMKELASVRKLPELMKMAKAFMKG